MFFNKFVPPFLKRLDAQFVKSAPLLWVTRIHYVLFYSIVAIGISLFFAFFYPLATNNVPNALITSLLFGIPSAVILFVWIYRQMLYNVESDFAQKSKIYNAQRLLIYMMVVTICAIAPFIVFEVMHTRIANLETEAQLRKEVDILNETNYLFSTGRHDDNYFAYTVQYSKYMADLKDGTLSDTDYSDLSNYDPTPFSLYSYDANDDYIKEPAIYREGQEVQYPAPIVGESDAVRLSKISKALMIYEKYGVYTYYSPETVLEHINRGQELYDMQKIDLINNMAYIHQNQRADTLFNGGFDTVGMILIALLFFYIVVLTKVLKHNSRRELLISILYTVGLGFSVGFLAFLVEMSDANPDEEFVGIIALVAIVYFFITSLSIFSSPKYSQYKVFVLNTFHLLSPLLITIVAIIFDELGVIGRISEYDAAGLCLVGMGLYSFVFNPIFDKLYERSKALPRT